MTEEKRAQKQCDHWNHVNPIGTDVILNNGCDGEMLTATRSIAVVRSGEAMIHLERMRDFSPLDHVRVRSCRVCGCTTYHACVQKVLTPYLDFEYISCHWVETDLCSACAVTAVQA